MADGLPSGLPETTAELPYRSAACPDCGGPLEWDEVERDEDGEAVGYEPGQCVACHRSFVVIDHAA